MKECGVTRGRAETTTPGCDEDTEPKLGAAFKLDVAAFSAGNAPVDDPRHHHGVVIDARTRRGLSSAAPRPAARARRLLCRPRAARLLNGLSALSKPKNLFYFVHFSQEAQFRNS